jgi:HK97 family phage prohead protease
MDLKQPRPLVPEDLLRGHPDVVPAMVRKTYATEAGAPEYILSDESLDRHGDQILVSGWDCREFRKNSICLFNHNPQHPIGRWTDVRVEGGALKGTLELAPEGTSPRIDEIRRLVQAQVLRATSVGFRVIQSRPRGKGLPGLIFEKQSLLECSLVSVPSNPNCVQIARSLGISADTRAIVFAKPGASTASATKPPPERPNAVVEARVARLETERKQLTRRLLLQVELLVDARPLVEALATVKGGSAELPAAIKRMRAHEAMAQAVSTLLGIAERELFSSEQEAERLKRVRGAMAREMKGRGK